MQLRNRFLLFPLALTGALLACENVSDIAGTPSADAEGAASVNILITDAPGDVKEAWVKIDRFVLKRVESDGDDDKVVSDTLPADTLPADTLAKDTTASDTTANATSGDDEDDSNRVVLEPSSDEWIELLSLAGGSLQDVIDGAGVPAGTYRELRIIIAGAYIVTEDDRVFALRGSELPEGVEADGELKCPSCSSSGLKIRFDRDGITVGEGENDIVIDFDVAQSLGHEAGKSGKFILNPVIRGSHEHHGHESRAEKQRRDEAKEQREEARKQRERDREKAKEERQAAKDERDKGRNNSDSDELRGDRQIEVGLERS